MYVTRGSVWFIPFGLNEGAVYPSLVRQDNIVRGLPRQYAEQRIPARCKVFSVLRYICYNSCNSYISVRWWSSCNSCTSLMYLVLVPFIFFLCSHLCTAVSVQAASLFGFGYLLFGGRSTKNESSSRGRLDIRVVNTRGESCRVDPMVLQTQHTGQRD